MGGVLQFLGDWGHVLAAALFAVLAIMTARQMGEQHLGKMLVASLSLMAIWLLSIAFGGVDRLQIGLMESLRNCGWLACIALFPTAATNGEEGQGDKRRWYIFIGLFLLLVGQCVFDIVNDRSWLSPQANVATDRIGLLLRMIWVVAVLALARYRYVHCASADRRFLAPLIAAMSAMWGYDLLVYAASLFDLNEATQWLYALRGGMMALLAPLLALLLRSQRGRTVQASRRLTWHGLGALGGLVAVLAVLGLLTAAENIGSPLLRNMVTAGVFLMVASVVLLMSATRLPDFLKLWINKHLFRHRYDYREQWMAFVDTIGTATQDGIPLTDRLLKAMADITDSSGAVLFMLDDDRGFVPHGAWNWKGAGPVGFHVDEGALERMRTRLWVFDIAQMRAAADPSLPLWMRHDSVAWAAVPLLHFGELIGTVVLAAPPIVRPLDWEDFDMLRAAGRQVASYIAEARGQQTLEEVRRFDEFNRRFAFIMHDIKNLISQIGLVARNAERHADNPEFRKDMILTLTECTDKMNVLLARLSQRSNRGERAITLFAMGDAVRAAVAMKSKRHPVLTEGDLAVTVRTDRAAIEQILTHLVQNAIEASEADMPVIVRVRQDGDAVEVAVIDHGCGMTAEFLRDQLYRPFASTKQGGFGIGAYEAKELAQSLGGQLKTESALGRGSIFTLRLPAAAFSYPRDSALLPGTKDKVA